MPPLNRTAFGVGSIAAGVLLHTVHPFGAIRIPAGSICTAHAQNPLPCLLCCAVALGLIAAGFAAIEAAAGRARGLQIPYGPLIRDRRAFLMPGRQHRNEALGPSLSVTTTGAPA